MPSDIFLVEEFDVNAEVWLKKHYDKYFCIFLEDWWTNKKDWPQKRNFPLFKKWFIYILTEGVFDTIPTPITKSEF